MHPLFQDGPDCVLRVWSQSWTSPWSILCRSVLTCCQQCGIITVEFRRKNTQGCWQYLEVVALWPILQIHDIWPLVGPAISSKSHVVVVWTVWLHTDHCKARISQYFSRMYYFKILVLSFGKDWGAFIQAEMFIQQNVVLLHIRACNNSHCGVFCFCPKEQLESPVHVICLQWI